MVKVMIGIIPRGAVSFISDCYPSATSDWQIIEDWDLYVNALTRFDRQDAIMADRNYGSRSVCTIRCSCEHSDTNAREESVGAV